MISRLVLLIALTAAMPAEAQHARISTFMEGVLKERTATQWVIETKEGTYWIKLSRPLSWLRRESGTKVSFWVRIDQITRFRPLKTLSAAAEAPYRRP